MTITIVFGADFVSTFVAIPLQNVADTCAAAITNIGAENIDCQQAADTCALQAYTDLGTTLTCQQAADSCAITVAGGITVALDLQQASDFGAIQLLSLPAVPNPNPVLNPPIGAGFVARAPVERYTVVVERTPATANEE